MTKKYLAPSVKKAFEILRTISLSREDMGLNEIARTLNIAKSTVHGIISILEEVGAVTRDPITRRYGLGLTLFELGRQVYSQIDIREIARPVMENLMETVQETVFLSMLSDEHESILVLDVVESRHDLKITAPVGSTLSIFAAAPGKVFLSLMDDDHIIDIIKKKEPPRYTDHTITDPDAFMEEIRRVRSKGYATDYEEYISGVRAVAAPIIGDKKQQAAIYVVGFKASLDEKKMEVLEKEIKSAAEIISSKIRERQH